MLHLGQRAALDQALSRLARRGTLLRIGRGLYVLPVESRYGQRAPSVEKTVTALAAQRGERLTGSPAMAANALGLTTQVPVTSIFLTSGPNRTLQLGRQKVQLRHAPAWQLALGETKAGQVVRALVWLGPDQVEAALGQVGRQLQSDERRLLATVGTTLPGWLAQPVSRLAHD
ncbi:DUF6088 family protein [Rubrimonas sp.]|uniref:DUF6088 family protein n=1 Tax=Rubrimonas sp. TaxID=2036015 RepID=UPI003FA7CA57